CRSHRRPPSSRPPGIRAGAAVGLLLALFLSPAAADDGLSSGASFEDRMNSSHYYVAVGPVLVSDYEGSDDYEVQPLVIARWIRAGAWVAFEGSTLKANVIPADRKSTRLNSSHVKSSYA